MSESSKISENAAKSYDSIEKTSDVDSKTTIIKEVKGWGARHTLCLMTFFAYFVNQTMRTSITVAIVAMVKQDSLDNSSYTQLGLECPFPEGFFNDDEGSSSSSVTFAWSAQEQGIVLGCFYYGFIVSMLPGAFIAEKFGGKWVLAVGIFGGSICSLISPLVVSKGGLWYYVALRVLQGFLQGPTSAVAFTLLGKWLPVKERNFLSSMVFNGNQFATIVTLALSGVLAENLGWEAIFYFFGALGAVIGIFWAFIVHESPNTHPSITESEKEFIYQGNDVSRKQIPTAPYLKILTSVPVWALVIGFLGSGWGYFSLLNETPTYLNNIQHFNLSENGLLSALPHLGFWILSPFLGLLADWLIKTDRVSLNTTRKTMSAIATYGPALALLGLAFNGCNTGLSVFWLTLALTVDAAMCAGYNVNAFDLSANYAGTIRGLSSTIANATGFLAPTVISFIIDGNNTLEAWKWVYILAAVLYGITGTFFLAFGSTKTQSWNTYWDVSSQHD